MATTSYGIFLFLVGFIVHVVLWRVRRPANTTVVIVLVFVVSIFIVWLALSILDFYSESVGLFPQEPADAI